MRSVLFTTAVAVALAGTAHAGEVSTVPDLIAGLKAGGTVTMANVVWPDIAITSLPAPGAGSIPRLLDATAAHIPSMTLTRVVGLSLKGGMFGPSTNNGLLIDHSSHIDITSARFLKPTNAAIRVTGSDHITETGNRVDGSLCAGFTYRGSSWIVIDQWQVHGGDPLPSCHPDAIQSVASSGRTMDAPSRHIWITNGVADGDTKGINAYPKTGPADEDVHITGNTITIRRLDCIIQWWTVGLEMTKNACHTMQPSKFGKVEIKTDGSTGVVVHGNTIDRNSWP